MRSWHEIVDDINVTSRDSPRWHDLLIELRDYNAAVDDESVDEEG